MFDNINTIALITFILFALTFGPFIKWYMKRAQLVNLINKIPGPKTFPLIGTAYLFLGRKREDIFKVIDARTKKYPNICRIWAGTIPEIRITKAEYVEPILHSSKHIEKSIGYVFLQQWLGFGLLTAKGDRWFRHRKIITPTFHFKILENSCDIFEEKSNILINILRSHSNTNKPVDIYPYIGRVALDIICDSAMGIQINAQEDYDGQYIRTITEITELFVRRLIRPWLHNDWIYKTFSSDGKKMAKCINILHNFTLNVIKERKLVRSQKLTEPSSNHKTKRLAFLDLLLEISSTDDNHLTDNQIREEVDTFMFEGHDTTTVGISWALLLLGLNPKIQDEVYKEIDSIFEGSSRNATYKDLNDMKYLECVLKETLRLYPSVPFIGRILSEDIQLDQYKIPSGCMIAVQIYHLHRDERYFPDPEKFDPDRFLPENCIDRHPFAYIPFSAGPRNCIGQKFALLEEKSIISKILRNFKITSVNKRDDVKILSELILRPLNGINLILEKRN